MAEWFLVSLTQCQNLGLNIIDTGNISLAGWCWWPWRWWRWCPCVSCPQRWGFRPSFTPGRSGTPPRCSATLLVSSPDPWGTCSGWAVAMLGPQWPSITPGPPLVSTGPPPLTIPPPRFTTPPQSTQCQLLLPSPRSPSCPPPTSRTSPCTRSPRQLQPMSPVPCTMPRLLQPMWRPLLRCMRLLQCMSHPRCLQLMSWILSQPPSPLQHRLKLQL